MMSNNVKVQKQSSLLGVVIKWITILCGIGLVIYTVYFQMQQNMINSLESVKGIGILLLLLLTAALFDNKWLIKKIEKTECSIGLNVFLGMITVFSFIILSLLVLKLFVSKDIYNFSSILVYLVGLIFFIELIFKRLLLKTSLNFIIFTLVVVLGNTDSIGILLGIILLVLIHLYHNKDIIKSLLNYDVIDDQKLHRSHFTMNLTFLGAILIICVEELVLKGIFIQSIAMLLSNEVEIPIYIVNKVGRIILVVLIMLCYLSNYQIKNVVDKIKERLQLEASKFIKK